MWMEVAKRPKYNKHTDTHMAKDTEARDARTCITQTLIHLHTYPHSHARVMKPLAGESSMKTITHVLGSNWPTDQVSIAAES